MLKIQKVSPYQYKLLDIVCVQTNQYSIGVLEGFVFDG